MLARLFLINRALDARAWATSISELKSDFSFSYSGLTLIRDAQVTLPALA